MTRPTEVEWVEMNYDHGRQASDPAVRVVDMKKKQEWEGDDPKSTVEIMPIEQSNTTRRKTAPFTIGDTSSRGPFRTSPQLLDRSRPFDQEKGKSTMVVPVNIISLTPGKILTIEYDLQLSHF